MFCGSCGEKISGTQKYCSKCGAALNASGDVQNVQPQIVAESSHNSLPPLPQTKEVYRHTPGEKTQTRSLISKIIAVAINTLIWVSITAGLVWLAKYAVDEKAIDEGLARFGMVVFVLGGGYLIIAIAKDIISDDDF